MSSAGRPTIFDVAKKAKVGTTTVSRVINGGHRVAPGVRERVEAVMRELHYQPNGAARSLAREKNQSIGLIVPRLSDPFFANIAGVVQQICRSRDHILMISTSSDIEEQAIDELKVFEQQRVEGVLIVPPGRQSNLFRDYCHRFENRTVAIDLPVSRSSISSVQTDNADAATVATDHLIQHGRKRILFVGADPDLHTLRERRRGYLEAIDGAGLRPFVADGVYSTEMMEGTLLPALKGKDSIDAIFTANSTLGMFAFQVLKKHKISVPERVALVTFDDFALADTLTPSVTCVAQPIDELARTATELLFHQLDGTEVKTRRVHIPSQLILRESCGCPAH